MNNYKEATYIIAMVKEHPRKGPTITLLDTGRRYNKMAAEVRAGELNNTCKEELVALDYTQFVAYGLGSE
jgi:hypothetical protein